MSSEKRLQIFLETHVRLLAAKARRIKSLASALFFFQIADLDTGHKNGRALARGG